MEIIKYTLNEWMAEGRRRFGDDFMAWRFVCPICGNVATVRDYEAFKEQGATPDNATNECIGRYVGGGREAFGTDRKPSSTKPCNYAGYGLFRLSPVYVTLENGHERHAFGFAEPGKLNRK